jgi:actin related protein 2/3 complex subunit 3
MGYPSKFNEKEVAVDGKTTLIGCGMYAIKQTPSCGSAGGPAPRLETDDDAEDILDEVLYYFKPRMLLHTYPMEGPADRLSLYLTLFVHQCLVKLAPPRGSLVTKNQAKSVLHAFANESVVSPGDASYPFNAMYPAASAEEAAAFKDYAKQLKLELAARLAVKVFAFPGEGDTGNKFWLPFAKTSLLGLPVVK